MECFCDEVCRRCGGPRRRRRLREEDGNVAAAREQRLDEVERIWRERGRGHLQRNLQRLARRKGRVYVACRSLQRLHCVWVHAEGDGVEGGGDEVRHARVEECRDSCRDVCKELFGRRRRRCLTWCSSKCSSIECSHNSCSDPCGNRRGVCNTLLCTASGRALSRGWECSGSRKGGSRGWGRSRHCKCRCPPSLCHCARECCKRASDEEVHALTHGCVRVLHVKQRRVGGEVVTQR